MTCPARDTTHRALEARDADTLSASDERRLKAHLLECAECADDGVAFDSTMLFSSLAASNDPEPVEGTRSRTLEIDGQAVVRDVMAAVEIERARKRLRPSRGQAWLKAASFALLGGLLAALVIAKGGFRLSRAQDSAVASSTSSSASGPGREGLAATRTSTGPLGSGFIAERGTPVRRPLIEGLENPGARVYQFASDSPKEPNVVFVVDRNADL